MSTATTPLAMPSTSSVTSELVLLLAERWRVMSWRAARVWATYLTSGRHTTDARINGCWKDRLSTILSSIVLLWRPLWWWRRRWDSVLLMLRRTIERRRRRTVAARVGRVALRWWRVDRLIWRRAWWTCEGR